MVEGRKSHPLKQVMPHPRGTNDSVTQLGAPSLLKGELQKLLSTFPLRHGPDAPSLAGLMLRRKLILKESNLSNKAISILTSRG
jgi:hypothetical protein